MSRLRYSRNGIVRAVEMSRASVTAFVEGFLDRTFFGAILANNPALAGKAVDIRLAHELHPSLGNGKTALLALHATLKQNKRLMYSTGNGQKAAFFFLDKDVDDLRKTRRRCAHAIYTEHYSVENYLFRNGDLAKSLACGGCIDCQSLGTMPTNKAWTNHAARSWAEWIAFCLMTARFGVPGLPNFGVKSLIHDGEYKPLDAAKEGNLLAAVSNRTGRTTDSVQAAYNREIKRVTEYLGRDAIDGFFNGKWYSGFLAKDAKRLARGRQLPPSIEDRLEAALLATLDFRGTWANNLQQKVTAILNQL